MYLQGIAYDNEEMRAVKLNLSRYKLRLEAVEAVEKSYRRTEETD